MFSIPSPDDLKKSAKNYLMLFPDCELSHCQVLEKFAREGGFRSYMHYLSVYRKLNGSM